MSINLQKQMLRKTMKAKRASLHESERARLSMIICENIMKHPSAANLQAGAVLLTYMPVQAEVDVKPMMEWAWRRGIHVLLPRVDQDSNTLSLHEIADHTQLVKGPWDISEPSIEAPEWEQDHAIDIVLVPGVAYDMHGNRLGQGGGFYDRLWEQWRASANESQRTPYLLAPAYTVQVVDQLPIESHDMKVDCIVTELGSIGQ